jgi:hypothetical protein
VECKNCGATLKPNKAHRIIHLLAILCAVGLSAISTKLQHFFGWDGFTGWLFLIVMLLTVGIPAEFIAWKYCGYSLQKSELDNTT